MWAAAATVLKSLEVAELGRCRSLQVVTEKAVGLTDSLATFSLCTYVEQLANQ